jgi:hypothetical protein
MNTSASKTFSTTSHETLRVGVSKRRSSEGSSFAVRCARGIYSLLVRVPFALALSLLAIAASSVALAFSALLCLVYRIIWYGTREGRLYRRSNRMEKRKGKIREKERLRRIRLSRRCEQKNIGELITIVRRELDRRNNEIMIDVSVIARIALRDCLRDLDFDTAVEIYAILNQSQAGSVNQRLGRQLGLNQRI